MFRNIFLPQYLNLFSVNDKDLQIPNNSDIDVPEDQDRGNEKKQHVLTNETRTQKTCKDGCDENTKDYIFKGKKEKVLVISCFVFR